jgi:uncharacterized protein (DUF1800 family)
MGLSGRLVARCGCTLAASLSLLWMAGCSSGSVSGSTGTTPQISVSVAGASSTRLSATTQFTATVTGTTNTAVAWQVNGVTGGSATNGTISTSGLYTAPATMPGSTSVTVSAISVASPTATGALTESLQNPIPTLSAATGTQVGSTLSYTIVATGTGFVSTSVIQAAGASQITTFVSSTQLTATVTVPSGTTNLNVLVANPAPGAANSVMLNIPITYFSTTATAAARFLDQSSFGPTAATIQQVQTLGITAYLNQQLATPTTTMAAIPTNPLPAVCLSANNPYVCAESQWWTIAITGNDQLRQRVAFALSEIFVVSTQSISGASIPQFHNMLANDAFTNFSTIMHDVAVSPAMGGYLNMLNSAKAPTGEIPNENFPRENMQLFTIGLDLLNQDGSLQLDGSGNPIPTYTEATVQAFAKVDTGWTYALAGGGTPTKFPNNTVDYADPMVAVESQHDMTSKTVLNGTVLSAGQTAEQDLAQGLANVFNHPNVGPFVCKQLIQHLVTSTPSPAYVSRVAAIFANDGTGVRGNMQAVITAILTDQEARAGDTNSSFDGGHLREPVLFITAMMRGLAFTNTDVNGSYFSLSSQSTKLSEEPYRSGSVFNFFPPSYVIPGTTLNAPEFDIENTATSILELSLADSIVNNKINSFTVDLSATGTLGTMAANPTTLVNYLSMLFMHSQMPSNMQSTIVSTITPLTNNAQRARIATYLVITSSQYKIIH